MLSRNRLSLGVRSPTVIKFITALFGVMAITAWALTGDNNREQNNENTECEYRETQTYDHAGINSRTIFACGQRAKESVEKGSDKSITKSSISRIAEGIHLWLRRALGDPVAAATIVLTASTIFLWIETKRLAKGAERDGRPWIEVTHPSDIQITDHFPGVEKTGWLSFNLIFRNIGKSPAANCRFNIKANITKNGAHGDGIVVRGPNMDIGVIFPDKTHEELVAVGYPLDLDDFWGLNYIIIGEFIYTGADDNREYRTPVAMRPRIHSQRSQIDGKIKRIYLSKGAYKASLLRAKYPGPKPYPT